MFFAMGFGGVIDRAACLSLAIGALFAGHADCRYTLRDVAPPTAVTQQGTVSGFEDAHGNSVFLGIPFAATTGGQNRWKAPQDAPKYSAAFDATKFGPTCAQFISNKFYTQQDEDCLNLNVWAPPSGKKLPVFVYIYGGAMVTGSSSNPQYSGYNFPQKDVIFVSFNFRGSIYGYPFSSELDGTSQNFGILDVEKALEWVHDNIEAFGGDPNHIVLGGHSSGSVHVDYYLWNHPDSWLAGAVVMSANAITGPKYAPMNVALDVVAAEVGCGTGKGQLDCLRKVDTYAFQTAKYNSTTNGWFTPAVDDLTRFADYPARFKEGKYPSHVPLLTGTSDKEGNIFSIVNAPATSNFSTWINTFNADIAHIPDDVLLALYNQSDYATEALRSGQEIGDVRFDCALDYFNDLRSTTQDTWQYRFFGMYDNVVGVPGTAPTHGGEIPFFLGGNECFSTLSNVTDAQQALADSINTWFVSWIKDPKAGPGWDKVTPKSGPLVKIGVPGDELSILDGKSSDYNTRCQSTINQYYPKYPVVQNPVTLMS